MTKDQRKLNNRYFKLLVDYDKKNREAKNIKQEMMRIRQIITPCQQLVDERPDELILKS